MNNEYYNNLQYDSCVSRGICSINPRISALQTVIILYLRLFAKYSIKLELDRTIKDFLLNTIAITIYNPEFNENSFLFAVKKFREELPKLIEKFYKSNAESELDNEKTKAQKLFEETNDVIQAIKFGEQIFNRSLEKIPSNIRDLYNIILVITKSLSINLLDLASFNKEHEEAFDMILYLLNRINLEETDAELLKEDIYKASKIDIELMILIRNTQEEIYGIQEVKDISYSTIPNKAVLVVGSNIKELENVLEALKEEEIDVYTHDDMMLAHTFPKFSTYPRLKGQFGQGLENCLLDFATFPGPIILTKHSLHNIENLYRGRLFTTDYTTNPKGIIKITNNDYSKVIKSAKESRGFKNGKHCETITIGYEFNKIYNLIKSKIENKDYKQILIIGIDGYSLEQKTYFENLIKLLPKDILIISFSYGIEKENLIHINACFDYYSIVKIFNSIKELGCLIKIFIPKCERNTISQMIYFSHHENTQVYVGKCTPIILNPSLINTLQSTFSIKSITNAKKDIKELF